MTVQDAVPLHSTAPASTPPASTAPRRHVGAAAVAALGVYLVIALSQVIETMLYVVADYARDGLGSLRYMLPALASEWFLSPLPFVLMVWLGFAAFFAIRATLRTRAVIMRSLLTALVGILVTAVFVAVGALLTMLAAAFAYGGPIPYSVDDVLFRFPGLVNSVVSAIGTLITTGTLATVSAGLLLREHLRKIARLSA